jgi:hypothetical protein
MRLNEFMDQFGITASGAAKRIEMSTHHFRQVAAGKARVSRRLAKDIAEYTRGAVSVEEILSIYTDNESNKPRPQIDDQCESIK